MTPKRGATPEQIKQMLEFHQKREIDAQSSPKIHSSAQVRNATFLKPLPLQKQKGPLPLGGGPGVKPMPSPGIPRSGAQLLGATLKGASPASPTQSQMQALARHMAGPSAAMKPPMMKSGGEVKREVESLASRYPKKGIDPTIPAGIREKLVEQEREKRFKAGEKAHSERTLAKGGSAKAYPKGGMTRADGCVMKGRTKGRTV